MNSRMNQLEACTILNIKENSPMEEVKRAHKEMSLRYHPDKNPGNPDANKNFGKIQKAYEYLVELNKIILPQQVNNDIRVARNQPLPKELQLWLTLEEMYNGCVKEEKITRKFINQSGEEENEEVVLQVNVSPETLPNAKITFEQAGDRITGNVPANVVFVVNELPHVDFKRKRFDLVYIVKITVEQTCLLDSLPIPFLNKNGDPIIVEIDSIITKDKTINIPEHGFAIPKKNGKRGNLIVKFDIVYSTMPQDPPVEYFVDVTLEQILCGCTQKLTITRHIVEQDEAERIEDYECIVKVPPGTDTGKRYTFHQKGDKHPDRIPADIIIIVRVEPHMFFKRNGIDIEHTICVTLSQARKDGLSFKVPTLSETDKLLQLDEPIAFGTIKRYPGFGLPQVEQQEIRGDLIVRFEILNDNRVDETSEYDLKVTLENILFGYKLLKITRTIYDEDMNEFKLTKVIKININPGTKIGQTYRFSRMGNKYPGFIPGDVLFVVSESPHKKFKRINDVDLEYIAIIDQKVFAKGGQIKIPTLDNKEIDLSLDQIFDPSTANKSFVGYGLPYFGEKDKRGNLLVRFELFRA